VKKRMSKLAEMQNTPWCKNCRINKQATEPFIKMVKIKNSAKIGKVLEELSELTKEPKECIVCYCVKEFFSKTDAQKLEWLEKGHN
jgi:hypothetical protein